MTHTMPPVAVLLCLCSLTLWTAADGNVFTIQLTSKIEQFVQNLVQCRGVVGLTLAIVKGNETWTRGFGVADRASGRPVNSSTLFGIGSVTKAFTSTILGILMEESQGKYTWQTRVKDILGDDFQLADEYVTSHVTVKDLLVHRTGLATSMIPLFAGFPATLTRKEFASRFRYLPVAGQFRDEYNYNNWMYALAGRVAEVMGGASWEELLHTRIFQSLQMTDSRVIGYNVQVDADNFALPYVLLRNEVVLSDPAVYPIHPDDPAGAIASSADDMAKWLSLHLQDGVTSDGDVIVNKTTLQDMHTPHMLIPAEFRNRFYVLKPTFPVTFNNFGYGYAWITGSYKGFSVVWHSGGIYSYLTYLTLIPDLDLGIFISTNGPGNDNVILTLQEIFFYIVDLFLEEEPWLNITNACQFPEPWLNTTAQTPPSNDTIIVPGAVENPHSFVGQYTNLLFGDISVTLNGTEELLVKYGRLTGKLHKTNDSHVLMMEVDGVMAFIMHPGDSVQYFNTTFTSVDESGKYQEILLSFAAPVKSDVLHYNRTVDASSRDTDSSGSTGTGSSGSTGTGSSGSAGTGSSGSTGTGSSGSAGTGSSGSTGTGSSGSTGTGSSGSTGTGVAVSFSVNMPVLSTSLLTIHCIVVRMLGSMEL